MKEVFVLGVCGGSGSGKTTFSKRLNQALGDERSVIIGQDSYYIDQSHKFDKDGGSVNFDHPSAIDFDLMQEHILMLKNNQAIEVPIYDFATHSRVSETVHIEPREIIIVDGILLLSQEKVRETFTESVFLQTPEDLRFERRLKRDVKERGRTPEGVKAQFEKQVKPMHDEFVEPSRVYATHTVKTLEEFDHCLELMIKKLKI